jgi:hypothetical protein
LLFLPRPLLDPQVKLDGHPGGFAKEYAGKETRMNIPWKTVLHFALVWSIGEMAAVAQTKTAPSAEPVKDVLPKAAPSPEIEALRKQLSSVIVFRDPITGEFRAADPGEQAALTGNRPGIARVAAPAAGRLPSGGRYLQYNPAKLQFLTAVKNAGGAVSFHSAPAGPKVAKSKETRDEK